jgi:hypothetical protein
MGRISDTLPLGWYEGIFQSYMPMRVSTTRRVYSISRSLLSLSP